MPFITDELWRALTGGDTVMLAPWPAADPSLRDPNAESGMAFLQEIVVALRRFKTHHRIEPKTRPSGSIAVGDAARRALLEAELERVTALAAWGDLRVVEQVPDAAGEARLVTTGAVTHVPLAGLIDLDAERARLRREIDKHRSEVARIETKLANPRFVEQAPEEVVETQRERLAREQDALASLDEALRELGG